MVAHVKTVIICWAPKSKNDNALGWFTCLTLKLLDNYSVLFLYCYYYYRFKVQRRQLFWLRWLSGSADTWRQGDISIKPWPFRSALLVPTQLSGCVWEWKHWPNRRQCKNTGSFVRLRKLKRTGVTDLLHSHTYIYWMWPKNPGVYFFFFVVCWFFTKKNQLKVNVYYLEGLKKKSVTF